MERTSRTFAIGIRRLPRKLRRSVSVAYLLLRVSDYFEDNERMSPTEKIAALNGWASILGDEGEPGSAAALPLDIAADDPLPDAHAVRDVGSILAAFKALPAEHHDYVRTHVVASTHGMARWVESGPAFTSESDLDDYMFEVAGRVGHLLTDLFAAEIPRVADRKAHFDRLGRDFGLGLQTVNVIRGLHEDPERGWLFIPTDFLGQSGDGIKNGMQGGLDRPTRLKALDLLTSKADRHLQAAEEYVVGLPRSEWGVRLFCLLPLLFATRTVGLSAGNDSVFETEVKLERAEVMRITRTAHLGAGSNAWVRREWRRLRAI